MAKEVVAKAQVDNLDDLLNLDVAEIKSQTPAGGGRGKRSNWDNLTDDVKKIIHKKVLLNNKFAAEFKLGQRDSVVFFDINEANTNTKTPEIHRGQKISFVKDGTMHNTIVIGFTQAGTGKYLKYKDGEAEVKFPVSGMSIETPVGTKAITKCNLNPKEDAETPAE